MLRTSLPLLEGVPQVMRTWEYGAPFEPQLFVAKGVFELDELWIVLSDLD